VALAHLSGLLGRNLPDRECTQQEPKVTKVTDDQALLDELCGLGETLGPFLGGVVTNTLSVTEQLDFGYRLIRVAGLIRARVEHKNSDTGGNGSAPCAED
jgi:hypothetical protein